ncbi:putative claudin-24 [Betta splendens]|uniref:Claudin n=1 Tax=Betta splendens TaxID=158456 RepID=A0A9W2XKB2_BETSP|nr:putative claudin-24 [Betta splendens]XP_055362060.1 putative claudin-24 [Betta splendens]
MDSNVSALELLGLFVSIVAWLCTLSSTLMPSWLNLNTDLLPIENFYVGLWGTCVIQDMGDGNECRLYDSMLDLPLDIMLARILMCVAVALGVLGLLLTIPGLHQVKCFHGQSGAKRGLRMAGGVLCLLDGLLVLIPVSYIAHLTLIRFFDETLPDIYERWEFGEALFCGWAAGFLYLVAGTLLLVSCVHLKDEQPDLPGARPMMGPPPRPFTSRSQYI